ncbi:MAG: hypothetical protein OEY62_04210, partial [Acidimicrobiia bacterium]|nr:hypothetical protein [Acidimicrobiia bacterium]
ALGLGTGVYPLDGEAGGIDVVVVPGGVVVVVKGAEAVVVVVTGDRGAVADLDAGSSGKASVTEVSAAASLSGAAPSLLSSPPPPSANTRVAATASAAMPAKVRPRALDLTDTIMPRPRSNPEPRLMMLRSVSSVQASWSRRGWSQSTPPAPSDGPSMTPTPPPAEKRAE